MALAPLSLKELKKNERETDKDEFGYLQKGQDVDGRTTKQSKEHDDIEWDGMEECEDILEKDNTLSKDELSKESITNEKIFEEFHKTNEGKESLGDRESQSHKEQIKDDKTHSPKMEEYVKQREDQLLAMSGGNVLHYQTEAMENMSGQNYMNQSVQVITEDVHNEREFAMTDDVVEDAYDMSENIESIDDISLDIEKDNGIVYIYADEEDNSRMSYPGLDDEPAFSGEIEHKNPWSN